MKNKVVCVSLGRNGTQSLSIFLKNLGYTCVHWIDPAYENESYSVNSKYKLKKYIELFENDYDAYVDTSFSIMYDYFDKKYKNVKFIFITRSIESYLASVKKYINYQKFSNVSMEQHPIAKVVVDQYIDSQNKKIDEISDEEYSYIYNAHTETVLEYFKDSSNFLHIDLDDEKISEKLCIFLGLDKPVDFPKIDFASKRI
jgi:hypothetical protein